MRVLPHFVVVIFIIARAGVCPADGGEDQRDDASFNWPLPPHQLEQLLSHEDFEIRAHEDAGDGVTGAGKWTLWFPAAEVEFDVKWKEVPPDTVDDCNNSPRKEVAAYEIQKWFLDPEDYVVPTTVMRCVPLDVYRQYDGAARASIEGTNCVLGAMAVWLQNVTLPEELYEASRFTEDRHSASHLADMNLLTYLIDHNDSRVGNFLISTSPTNRRAFTIDNGLSFGAVVATPPQGPSLLARFAPLQWNEINVPALPREAINRLRRVDQQQIEQLGVIVQLQAEQGILQPVAPAANTDLSKGARVSRGTVQLGLEKKEIVGVQERVQDLLRKTHAGEITTF